MRFGSLFSGIGGLDLGLERAGMECAWQVEIDPYATRVLAKHWPDVERHSDVRLCGRDNLATVDLICGGFPCQDVSIAGKQAGIDGERSGLWREFHRIIGEIRPRFILMENVPGLLIRGIGRVLGDLAKIGYDAEWDCVSAKDVGAPHLRERVFIVAYPDKTRYSDFTSMRSSEDNGKSDGPSRQQRRNDQQPWADADTPDNASNAGEERVQGVFSGEIQGFAEFSWCKDVRRIEDLRGRSDIPEPLFRGGRDGVSNWMDRIGCLGNAVVPQVAEFIGRSIMAAA